MGFAKDKFIHFHRMSARRAPVLWKCMNESLAEPFFWFWVSGKGILWNYSIKLQNVKNADILLSKNSWNQCNTNGHHQEVNNHLHPGGHHREINEKVKTIYLLVVFLVKDKLQKWIWRSFEFFETFKLLHIFNSHSNIIWVSLKVMHFYKVWGV